MVDAKIEGVGVPVPVSGVVESVTATSSSPADRVGIATRSCVADLQMISAMVCRNDATARQ